ncbi:SRPBCC domain-containing protein [Thermocladium modestius]|uniref:SRPBCC domain-containing protein n=1 Tax=Thermocladium modestius TaxID=62609 RepID=UPI00166D35DA|nr:SRPBCC domain-containing protein [Thermocladium modestius]
MSELTYEGSFNVGKPAGEVMEFIRDLGRVAPCIPNVVSHSVEGRRGRVKFRVDLGDEVPIAELRRVTADTEIEVTPIEGGASYIISGRAAGGSVKVELTLTVKQGVGGSTVEWRAKASLSRALAMVRRFIDLDSMVRRIAQDTVSGIVKCMAGSSQP